MAAVSPSCMTGQKAAEVVQSYVVSHEDVILHLSLPSSQLLRWPWGRGALPAQESLICASPQTTSPWAAAQSFPATVKGAGMQLAAAGAEHGSAGCWKQASEHVRAGGRGNAVFGFSRPLKPWFLRNHVSR